MLETGGNVVLLYASKYHDVHRVIDVSGRYKTEGGVKEHLGKGVLTVHESDDSVVQVEEALGFANVIPNHKLQIIKGADHRVLTVHESDDSVVQVEEALGFANVIPNHKLQIIKGADHRFSEHRT
ncbi:alpha/beta-Hydrolases superfamily protein [Artemisia annua]|uniref:Alpha/beta-Hydrolases superfamily protein n=1 Tax=Artemisia annua TaxID=35608 RepID=A0A2U1NG48_ARTAN|nr:alpha/beta-Hydrolases superfamily protein [Artemisia annua]